MIENKLYGIALIIVGFIAIWFVKKNPSEKMWSVNFKGYMFGICSIIIGFVLLFLKNNPPARNEI